MTIRKATISDLPKIAQIHKENFQDHYLGKFSLSLISSFYEDFIGLDSFIVYESDSSEIVGFILGGINTELDKRSNSFIHKNPMLYIWEIIIHPNTWTESLKKLYVIVKNNCMLKKSSTSKGVSSCFSLLSIAVAKSVQRKGIAHNMVQYFETLCPFDSYRLSVHENNVKARIFYEKNGMQYYAISQKGTVGYRKYIKKSH